MHKFLQMLCIILFLSSLQVLSQPVQQKNYLALSTAVFDFLQEERPSLEVRVEYKMSSVDWVVKPFSGFMTNTDGAINLFVGLFKDFHITSFLYFTPSFAPSIYYKHKSKDLYFLLEFRSGFELTARFENDVRAGISFFHVSNASLGKLNPGVESLAITYYLPL